MATYQITAPDGNKYRLTGPDNATQQDLINALLTQHPMAGKTTAELEAAPSAPTSLGDITKSFASGLIGGGKSLIDVFGAGSGLSQGLGEAQDYLQRSLTPERQAEIARDQELMQRAQGQGIVPEIMAGLKTVAHAPLQGIAQGVGSSLPMIVGGLATLPESAPAALALGVERATSLLIAAAQGVGETKGSIHDEVKKAYMEKGVPEAEAAKLAVKAQEYTLEKGPMLIGSAAFGALDALTGFEKSTSRALKDAFKGEERQLEGQGLKAAIANLPEKAKELPTIGKSLLHTAGEEGITEALQGGYGQAAQNIGMSQAGFETPTMEGVYGSAAHDALIGALTGASMSPMHYRGAKADYAADQFLRQVKAQQELEQQKADALRQQEEARAKTEGELGVPKMLALPAPAKEAEQEKDPLQNPIGNITEKELGSKLVGDIKNYRRENNLPPLKSYSIEDIKDAVSDRSTEEQEGIINRILAFKTNHQGQTYTPQNILDSAVANNVATETKGWNDFLTRVTGKSDLESMTQPELHAVSNALEELKKTGRSNREEQLVLPEGSNATRFTQDQYNAGITAALLGEKPVTLDEALKRVQTQKGIDSDQAAERLLRAAAANDDLTIEKGTGFQAVSATGKVLGTYASEAEARRNHRRVDIVPVETELVSPRVEESTEKVAQLPEGYQIKTKMVAGESTPALYVVRVEGSEKNESQYFSEEDRAKERLNALTRSREAASKAKEAEAGRIQKNLEKEQAKIVKMETDGLAGTTEHTNAVNKFQAAEVTEGEKVKALLDKAEELRQPLKIVPLGKKTSKVEKHTVIKNGKEIGTFTGDKGKTGRTKAEEHILSQASEQELQTIADRGGVFGKRAEVELDTRKRPGIRGGTTAGLEAAGVHTPEVETKLKELEAKLIPMLKKFGLEQVGLNVVRAIENDADGAWGKADKLIRIALQATNPIKTMRHEALHALKELGFFTDAQWEALKRQAEKTWVDKYLKGQMVEVAGQKMTRYDAYANGIRDENGNLLMAPLSYNDILEEAIADAFGDFEAAGKAPAGMLAALFKRLQQFFSSLRQALTGAGFESAEDIFGKIERGELKAGKEAGGAEFKASVKNITKGMLNPNIAPKYEKILEDVIKEMGLTPEEFASTSLIHQTGKAGIEQFETEKVGGLPEVIQFLQDERRKSGLPLLDIENADDRKIVAKLMATEAMAAIRSGGANLEWYDSVINKTLAMAGLKYPELNTDINARAAFRIATAITSQGLNVEDNLGFAMKVYDQFRQTGKFPEIGQGADQAAMINNFKLANYLMDDMGANQLRQFLETEFTVEELRSAGFNIAGELGDEKVLGSSVFGPKIGFGFYSNLNGNFEPVTMDMWFMRTIGRLTGKLKAFRQDLYDAQLKKFRDELDTQGSNGVFANQFDQNEIDLAKADDTAAEALARKVKSAHERDFKANRAAYDDGSRTKSKLVAASETMIKSLDSPKDAPANGSERRNLRDIVRQMVDIVEEKYGKRVPPASLQAVIWYPEQELYKALGVKLRVTSQNYAGAIEKILLGEGYGESELESAAKLGSRTAQQVARAAVSKAAKTTGAEPVRLGSLEAKEKESLLERGRKRVVLEQEKEAPRRKRVIFEVAPDPNNKALTEKWRSLPNDTRIEISDQIGNTIIKKALEQFGLTGYVDTQVGSYLDDTNPSFALYLDSGDAVNMAKFLGFVLSQDSMMVVSPKEGKGLEETGAVRINLGDVDAEKVDDIYQKLREIEVDGEKPVGGQSFMNGHMVVLNYSNVPTSQLATLINDKLNDNYEVITENVYTAFPEKKDYDYANPSSDPKGNAGVLRQASRDLRSEATRLLQKELKTIKPKAAPADQKLSLRKAGEPATRENILGAMQAAQEVQPYMNCQLCVQMATGVAKIRDLPKVQTPKTGDIFVFGERKDMASHYAIDLGNGNVAEIEEWGKQVREVPLANVEEEYGEPDSIRRPPDTAYTKEVTGDKYSLKTSFSTAEAAEKAAYKKAPPETSEFKRFFGASKVMEEGRPQVMYHASPNIFDQFRENKPIFVSPSPTEAEYYGKRHRTRKNMDVNVYPLWVRAETPFDYENKNHVAMIRQAMIEDPNIGEDFAMSEDRLSSGDWSAIEDPFVIKEIKKRGFDSFYVNEGGVKNLAVFNANQVKSVTGNIGEFGENKSIKYSLPVIPAAAAARRDETTQAREHKGFIERITDAFKPESLADLRASFIHRYNRLGFYDQKLAEKMGGKALLADMSAEAAANMSDLSASVTYAAFGIGNRKGGIPVYKNGMTTIDTSVKGPLQILSPLAQFNDPKAYQDYQYWAGVKRGSRFMAETSPTGVVSYREKNFDKGDIALAERVRQAYLAKGVDFNAIQKEMNTFNDGLVDYMKATGVLAPERAAEFKKHMDYIPFYRQLNGEDTVGPKIFNSISGVKPPKKLKGSEAPLTDYLESIVQNTQAAINAGMKNMAAQRAINVAMQLGPIAGAQRLNTVSSAPDTVQVLENGKQVSYRVADQLFINAVKSLNMAEIPFLGLFSAPSNLLRNLVTKDPGFMLANLARDSLSAWVTSGTNATPIIGTAANFAAALGGKSAVYHALLNAGILGGYEFSSGVIKSGQVLERDLNKRYGSAGAAAPLKVFKGVWDALEHATEASDAATRMAVYERVLEETGNETEALYRALEVMNFNRKGSSPVVRILTAAIPFLNARVQGLDVLYRTAFGQNVLSNAKEMQKAFFVRGATLMALSAAYFLAVSDDDDWKKQEQETKDNYWILPGVGKFPTPFEVGFLFKTIPERIMAYAMRDDTGQDFMQSMQRGLANTLAFNPIPQIAKPIIEYNADYNFFTGRPIVGQGMQGVEAQYQVGPNTTKTAEALGKALDMSPLKLDQLISSYTGTMGLYAMTLMDSILDTQSNSPHASKRFEQLPVIKRFAADPEARGNITQYYELKKAVDAAVQTENLLLKAGKAEEFADFMEKNAGLLAVKQYVANVEHSMKQMREMRKQIQGAEMSADEKRDTLTAIGQAENNLTANIQTVKKMVSEYQ